MSNDHDDWVIEDLMNDKRKYEELVKLLQEMHLYTSDDYGVHYKVFNVDKLLREVGLE